MPDKRVVYFPACPTRLFGAPTRENDLLPTPEAIIELLRRAGFDPVVPDDLEGSCCGQPFESKGFPQEAARVGARLQEKLAPLGDAGAVPMITDASTCARHMRTHMTDMPVMDSAEFLAAHVLPHLPVKHRVPVLAVHHNCSAQRLGEQAVVNRLAAAMAEKVIVLTSFTCCGYAGDKGLFVPELNAWATRFARAEVPAECRIGISTVSSCATGLTERIGIPFVSIASLLESVTRPNA
jgi:D-lactate dehydrogenase